MPAKLKPRGIFKCCKGGFHAKDDNERGEHNEIAACINNMLDVRDYLNNTAGHYTCYNSAKFYGYKADYSYSDAYD